MTDRLVTVKRVVVIGCAGSGKSTLARELAARTALPLTERDALGVLGSPEYRQALVRLAGQAAWILDGAPYYEDDLIYAAADTLIFLDYPRWFVMWRVLRRTFAVEVLRRTVGAHRPGGFGALRDRTHPLRWAWTSHPERRREGREVMQRADLADAAIWHFRRASSARDWGRASTADPGAGRRAGR